MIDESVLSIQDAVTYMILLLLKLSSGKPEQSPLQCGCTHTVRVKVVVNSQKIKKLKDKGIMS